MRRLLVMLASAVLTVTAASAYGQCPGRSYRQPSYAMYQRPVYPVQAVPKVAAVPVRAVAPTVQYQVQVQDGPAAFLAGLNAWRASRGIGPVGWDAGLAARAAGNRWVHDGTPGQCWSSSSSLMHSLRLWQASPAHAAILLSATVAVGASPCPSGATCNVR